MVSDTVSNTVSQNKKIITPFEQMSKELAGQSTREHSIRSRGKPLNNENSKMLGFVTLRLVSQTICSQASSSLKSDPYI